MHQNVVSSRVYTKILFSNNDIVLDFINSGTVRFSSDNMDILSIDLNNINLDDVTFHEDDPKIIIHVRLHIILITWHNRLKQ